MNKLNKQRQQMYLDGKVGLINDGTVEQFKEVAEGKGWEGNAKYYHGECAWDKYQKEGIDYHPTSWFYEEESELPKVGEWWECVEDVVMDTGETRFIKGKKYKCEYDGYLTNEAENPNHLIGSINFLNKYFIKSTAPNQQPTSWKLNIDVPEWRLKKGEICLDSSQLGGLVLPPSILQHIATPIYSTPFTLENGSEIQLSSKDIENIKKLN